MLCGGGRCLQGNEVVSDGSHRMSRARKSQPAGCLGSLRIAQLAREPPLKAAVRTDAHPQPPPSFSKTPSCCGEGRSKGEGGGRRKWEERVGVGSGVWAPRLSVVIAGASRVAEVGVNCRGNWVSQTSDAEEKKKRTLLLRLLRSLDSKRLAHGSGDDGGVSGRYGSGGEHGISLLQGGEDEESNAPVLPRWGRLLLSNSL